MVCGLNPHAGEAGDLGREEIDVSCCPVSNNCAPKAWTSPTRCPPTRCSRTAPRGADAVLAMYHDQGLPVLKSHSFGQAVNITLGLPFVRTSVDHGTAFDLAGSGRADDGSLRAALELAIVLAERRRGDRPA